MSSNLDPNSDLDRSQIDTGPSTSGLQDKKKNKKEVSLFQLTKPKTYLVPKLTFVPTRISCQTLITRSVEWYKKRGNVIKAAYRKPS